MDSEKLFPEGYPQIFKNEHLQEALGNLLDTIGAEDDSPDLPVDEVFNKSNMHYFLVELRNLMRTHEISDEELDKLLELDIYLIREGKPKNIPEADIRNIQNLSKIHGCQVGAWLFIQLVENFDHFAYRSDEYLNKWRQEILNLLIEDDYAYFMTFIPLEHAKPLERIEQPLHSTYFKVQKAFALSYVMGVFGEAGRYRLLNGLRYRP
jgi:hypothetical protein